MITHVLTFKLVDASDEHAAHCKSLLDGLLGRVPSLRSMLVGINVVDSPRAHDLALISTFDDLAGLAAYQVHPDHQEVSTYLRHAAEVIVSVDFEVSGSGS